MNRFSGNAAAIAALVRPNSVHRDVYRDPELFDLEMRRLWRRAWVYVGHASQVPNAGDYYTTDLTGQPLVMLRGGDGAVRVLMNRCAHKGARLLSATQGHCPGVLRCPYHGWTYRLDGSVRSIPLREGYSGSGLAESPASAGIAAVANVAEYRGFIFARLSAEGPGFQEYFGDSLSSMDNMADRSPWAGSR